MKGEKAKAGIVMANPLFKPFYSWERRESVTTKDDKNI